MKKIIGCAVCLVISTQLFSQEKTDTVKTLTSVEISPGTGLNRTTVNISRINATAREIPLSTAVVNASTIADQQALTLGEVLKNVTGISTPDIRGGVQEIFYARGYRLGSDNIYKNGFRVNSGILAEPSSLDRLEFLKGSAALMQGTVAPGGIINMVTKQPKFERGGSLSLRTGSYGLIQPSVDFYGPLSKNVAYRINGLYSKNNSYRVVVQQEKFYINPSFLFNIGSKTKLYVQSDFLHQDITPDYGIGTIDGNKLSGLSRNAFFGTAWQYNKQDQATVNIDLTHDFNKNIQLRFNNGFQYYKKDYYATERIAAKANGDWARTLAKTLTEERYYATNLSLALKAKTGKMAHQIMIGADADKYNTDNYTFTNPTIYDTINIFNPQKFSARNDIPAADFKTRVKTPLNRTGLYIQDFVSISSKFKMLAGLRYNAIKTEAVQTYNFISSASTSTVDANNTAFSPRLGLVYLPTNKLSLFTSYSNSFNVNTGVDLSGNALKPSITDQYEAGARLDFLNKKLSLNLTTYYIKNNNLAQTAPFLQDGTTANNNTNIKELTGATVSKGLEIDVEAVILKAFQLNAGASYNDYRYSDTKLAANNFIAGERVVGNPAITANVSGWYNFKNGKLKNFRVGMLANYLGDRTAGYNNRVGQSQQYNRNIQLDGFTTVDLSAGYSVKKIEVIVKLSNVGNTLNYLVHDNYSVNPIAPRQIIGTIRYNL